MFFLSQIEKICESQQKLSRTIPPGFSYDVERCCMASHTFKKGDYHGS